MTRVLFLLWIFLWVIWHPVIVKSLKEKRRLLGWDDKDALRKCFIGLCSYNHLKWNCPSLCECIFISLVFVLLSLLHQSVWCGCEKFTPLFFNLPSVQSSSRTDLGHLQSWLFLPTSVLSIMDGAPMCHPQGSGGWPCPSHPILSLERLPTGMVQPVHLRQFWSPDSSRSSGGGLFASTIFSSSLSNIALHLSVHTNHSSASVPVCLCLSSIKVCPGVRLRHVPGLCTSCAGQTRDPWRAQGLGGTGSAPEAYSRTSWQMCLHTPASG